MGLFQAVVLGVDCAVGVGHLDGEIGLGHDDVGSFNGCELAFRARLSILERDSAGCESERHGAVLLPGVLVCSCSLIGKDNVRSVPLDGTRAVRGIGVRCFDGEAHVLVLTFAIIFICSAIFFCASSAGIVHLDAASQASFHEIGAELFSAANLGRGSVHRGDLRFILYPVVSVGERGGHHLHSIILT